MHDNIFYMVLFILDMQIILNISTQLQYYNNLLFCKRQYVNALVILNFVSFSTLRKAVEVL